MTKSQKINKKIFTAILLTIFALQIVLPVSIKAQTTTDSEVQFSESIESDEKEAKQGIISKTKGILSRLFQKTSSKTKELVSRGLTQIKPWLNNRKQAFLRGLDEEKQEMKEEMKQGIRNKLSIYWQKVKNIFKKDSKKDSDESNEPE